MTQRQKNIKTNAGAKWIASGEWRMSEDCPDEELEECLVYEAARRSQFWPKAFKAMRRLGTLQEYHMRPVEVTVFRFLCLFDEFPKTPWLKIPATRRRQQLTTLLNGVKRIAPIETCGPYEAQFTYDKTTYTRNWSNGTEMLAKYSSRTKFDAEGHLEIHIDWYQNDETLNAYFKKWLKEEKNLFGNDHQRIEYIKNKAKKFMENKTIGNGTNTE